MPFVTLSRLSAAAALILLPIGLIAQTPPTEIIELDAVEVSAQKRIQSIQEVPIPITAHSGTFMEETGISQYKDLAPFVPGLFVQQQSPNFPGINIRGVTSDSTDPRSETRVSIFQDGVSISRATGSNVELFDLERIEVLKGPQGTLFGRGAEVGAISIIQRKPVNATEAALTAGFGRLNEQRLQGHVNTPLGSEHLLGRLALTQVSRDGTVGNLADGSDLNSRNTFAVRPSLRWLPSDRTTLDFIFNYQQDESSGTSFKSGVIPTSLGDTDPFTDAELNRGRRLGVNRAVWGGTLILTHEASDAWTITSITGARRFDSHEEFDADGSGIFLLELSDDSVGRQFSQEFRVNFDQGGRFAGFAGINYFKEEGVQTISLYTNERQVWPFLSGEFRGGLLAAGLPAGLVNIAVPMMHPFMPQANLPAGFAAFAGVPPLAGLAGLAGAPLKGYHTEQYRNLAESSVVEVFMDGTHRVTDRFEITAGLRVSFEDQTSGYEAFNAPVPSTLGFMLQAGPNLAFAPTSGPRDSSLDETSVVGRLAARFAVTSGLSTYASIARGRRPASIIIDSTTSTLADEEVIWNYEIGVKGHSPDRRFDYSASVFHYDYRNFQTSIRDPNNAARFITISAGNATGRGLELALRGRVNTATALFATYGYTDATFDDTGDNGQPQAYAGSSFRLTSDHTLSVGALFTWNHNRLGRFSFTPVYQYKSRHFFEDDNTRFGGTLSQGGFGLFNLRAGWRSRDQRWELSAYAENLLDEDYLIDAGNFGANFGIPTFIRGTPQLYGLSGTVRF